MPMKFLRNKETFPKDIIEIVLPNGETERQGLVK